MGFDPGKSFIPGFVFSLSFVRVIKQGTGFRVGVFELLEDLFFEIEIEFSSIVSF